jgi:mono/diheme cytochrome c family protein
MRHGSAFLLTLLLASGLTGCRFLRGYAEGPSAQMPPYEGKPPQGLYRLVFEDFQGLSTETMGRSAVPWKVLAAASLLHARQSDPQLPLTEATWVQLMRSRYGFVIPSRIANWPASAPQPQWPRPLGLVSGMVTRSLPSIEMEVANTGCSTCHAANLYDAEGNPTDEAWIGLPSSSINLEGYARNAYESFRFAIKDPEGLLTTIRQMFPETTERELDSLRRYYLPPVAERLAELEAKVGRFTPYTNGGPGLTNGAATLQYYLNMIEADRYHEDQVAFAAIPEFGGFRLRRSALADGVYSPPGWKHYGVLDEPMSQAHRDGMAGVACLVTVGTLGVEPDLAVENQGRMRQVIDYLFDEYRAPPFPGKVDRELAGRGEAVFQSRCQGCHGRYEAAKDGSYQLVSFPNRKVGQESMGTDPRRWQAVTDSVMEQFRRTPLGNVIDIQRSEGYVALPLTGVWATAPYLHNGSVPTLWHLMTPDSRPEKFLVGGHKLDFERLGIAGEVATDGVYRYPAGYAGWSLPEVYDTTQPGRGNGGHTTPFKDLDERQKRELLEFLKLL